MKIDKTLDVYRPGSLKYLDAWKGWSEKLAVRKSAGVLDQLEEWVLGVQTR
jgi:hypothetical protein